MIHSGVKVYSSDVKKRGFGRLFQGMNTDMRLSLHLAFTLAKRDIKAMYRQSLLGYVWAFIMPLMNTIIWIFLQGSGIVTVADTGMNYALYVFTGTMMWQIFTEAFQSPIVEVNAAKGLLTKLNFPREAIIISGLLKTIFNAAIKVALLIPVAFLFSSTIDWTILLFPIGIISIILVGLSFGLFLAPLGTLYGDVGKAIPLVTQFLMYFAPVVLPFPKEGISAFVFKINLLSPVIASSRSWLIGMENPWTLYFVIVNIIALALLFFAWAVFRLAMPILTERMSS